jgi:hypothetical protein
VLYTPVDGKGGGGVLSTVGGDSDISYVRVVIAFLKIYNLICINITLFS